MKLYKWWCIYLEGTKPERKTSGQYNQLYDLKTKKYGLLPACSHHQSKEIRNLLAQWNPVFYYARGSIWLFVMFFMKIEVILFFWLIIIFCSRILTEKEKLSLLLLLEICLYLLKKFFIIFFLCIALSAYCMLCILHVSYCIVYCICYVVYIATMWHDVVTCYEITGICNNNAYVHVFLVNHFTWCSKKFSKTISLNHLLFVGLSDSIFMYNWCEESRF